MSNTTDLRILFATSFSDACFRTSRAIAQLADRCRISLTIAHVAKPGVDSARRRRELDSFIAEADHYDECSRVLVEAEDCAGAIADLACRSSYDLVVAPASDRLGLHSLFTPSTRAKLMKKCRVPVWTAGSCLDAGPARTGIRTVACLADFEGQGNTHLPLAARFAARMGARLRIVHVIPPVHEGMLARAIDSDAPLMPEVAVAQIRKAFAGRPYPDIDVTVGYLDRELPGLLDRGEADLAFIGPGQALRGSWYRRLAPFIDRLPCPAVCVDGASCGFGKWTFQNVPQAEPEPVVARSGEYAMAH